LGGRGKGGQGQLSKERDKRYDGPKRPTGGVKGATSDPKRKEVGRGGVGTLKKKNRKIKRGMNDHNNEGGKRRFKPGEGSDIVASPGR